MLQISRSAVADSARGSRLSVGALIFAFVCLGYCCLDSVFDRVARIEYLALVPNGQGPQMQNGSFVTDWLKLVYPEQNLFQAADVEIEPLTKKEGNTVLGSAWRGQDLGKGAMLTGRYHDGKLYVFINAGKAPVARGCCADTLRIFSFDGSAHQDVLIVDVVRDAVNSIDGAEFQGISHAFHPTVLDGTTVFLLPVVYKEAALSGASVDGVIALDMTNLDSLKVHPTADGTPMFSPFRAVGTTNTTAAGTIFNIQYKKTGHSIFLQWHANNVQTFTTSDGTNVLGLCMRMDVDTVLFKDPYLHNHSDGGGKILQRFGSPQIFHAQETGDDYHELPTYAAHGKHSFGVQPSGFFPIVPGNGTPQKKAQGGLHNLYYYKHATGKETITVFANKLNDRDQSAVVEFEIKLVENHSVALTDHVFETNYSVLPLPFQADAQGGARPIGVGVYLVASGLADRGYVVIDSNGRTKEYPYNQKLLYDPFIFTTTTTQQASSLTLVLYKVAILLGLLAFACCWFMPMEAREQHPEHDSVYMPL